MKANAVFNVVKDTVVGLKKRENRIQFYKYAGIGLSAFTIETVSFNLLNLITSDLDILLLGFISVTLANIWHCVSMFLGTVFSYTMNHISFKSENPVIPEMIRFAILFFANLIVTNVIFSILHWTGLPAWFCKLCVQGMMVLWNFFIYKLVIFRPYKTKSK